MDRFRVLAAACLAAIVVAGCATVPKNQVGRPARAPAALRIPAQDAYLHVATSGQPQAVGFFSRSALDDDGEPSEVRLPADWVALHGIDVGQGDAFIIELACTAALIDTGGEVTEIEEDVTIDGPALFSKYVERFFRDRPHLQRRFELVVLSHPHKDHTSGAPWLSERVADADPATAISIGRLLHPGLVWPSNRVSGLPEARALVESLDEASVTAVSVADIERFGTDRGWSSTTIDPFQPCAPDTPDPKVALLWGFAGADWQPKNENNHSVVLRFDFGETSFLFTGDLQKEGIRQLLTGFQDAPEVLDVDVLKVGHHGSHNATTLELMAATSPKIAVIGVGDATIGVDGFTAFSHGHPHMHAYTALTDEEVGVSYAREPINVLIGTRGRFRETPSEFETRTVEHAIYTTGWDGSFVLFARQNGEFAIQTTR